MKKPVLTDDDLIAAYRRMSKDRQREQDADAWAEGLIEDVAEVPSNGRRPNAL